MDVSNGAGQIGVNDLLLARGVGGGYGGGFGGGFGGGGYGMGGGMYAGNNVLAAEAHANGTATNAHLTNLAAETRLSFDNSREVARESRNIDQFGRVTDNQFRAELRGADQIADLTREVASNARVMDKCCCDTNKAIADAAKEAALCCCDAKLEACKSHSELMATVLSENSKTRELMQTTALATATARVTQLETINALDHRHRG